MQKKVEDVASEFACIFKALLHGGYIDESRKESFMKLQKLLERFNSQKEKGGKE